jgi:hypothetical protein
MNAGCVGVEESGAVGWNPAWSIFEFDSRGKLYSGIDDSAGIVDLGESVILKAGLKL